MNEVLSQEEAIKVAHGVECVLCFRENESYNHLFTTCSFSQQVWKN